MTQHDAGAAGFSSLLETMAQLDFFTLVLPFILSYVVFLFALRQVELFKDDKQKGVPELIAIVAAFFTAQFIAANPFYQTFFIDYFGRLTIGIAGILGMLILLGMMGLGMDTFTKPVMVILLIAIVGASFTAAGGFGPTAGEVTEYDVSQLGPILIDTGLIWLLVIAGVLWWTAREPNEGDGGSLLEHLFEDIGDN